MKNSKEKKSSSDLIGTELEVRVDKLAVGGWGLGRVESLSGIVCFIPDAAPGDFLKIKVTEAHKNHLFAEVIQILETGPERRTPPCPKATECGGCDWQHLTDSFQLQQKEILLQETLNKFLSEQIKSVNPIRKSPKNFNYRSRIQPKIVEGEIGFYAKRSHQLVPISECLIAEPPLNALFSQIKTQNQKNRSATLESPLKFEFYLDEQEQAKCRNLEEESDEDLGFSQVNRLQNKELIEWILQIIENQNFTQIYDLYAGSGNFTFPISDKFKKTKIFAVEKHSTLAQRGRDLAQRKPIEFINSSIELFIKRHAIADGSLVLLDPPRGGAEALLMKSLAHARPQKILYISCNPVTMARDLKVYFDELKLNTKNDSTYHIRSIQPFEMFPQTSHMETIIEISPD
ncbi:MAG TPA: TRAM domain-containing protein [Pseudobdellovibrionaceae bacterium]|nr:TRAM domain-containing protein [Pseudobdellovibrionaceae bacterium]